MRGRIWIAMALGLAPKMALAEAPSFACSGTLSPTEAAICAAPELALADRVLAGIWRATPRPDRAAGRAFLARRDLCGTDRACLRDAYGGRIAELGGLSEVENAGLTAFRWNKPLDGIRVGGLWAPAIPQTEDRMRGPALFELVSDEARTVLVAPDVALADALPMDGPLALDWPSRAAPGKCRQRAEMTCLSLGDSPFDLVDLDFDGRPEAVVAGDGPGQRGAPLLWAWSLPGGRELVRDAEVFGRIDGLTSFDPARKEIEVMRSNGGCDVTLDTYAGARDFAQVQSDVWSVEGGACHHDRTRLGADGTATTTRLDD